MSVDKKGFKDRVSNVLAWGGCLGFIGSLLFFVNDGLVINRSEETLWGLAVYLGCALINYLMVGKMRLLPWKDIE